MSFILVALALTQKADVSVPFRTLSFGSNAAIKDGGAIVMRDAAAFGDYRKRMGMPDGRKPLVDWGKENVVAIHAQGTIPTGTASIHVVSVSKKPDDSLTVDVYLDRGNRPATPTPGVPQVLKQQGFYTLIVVPLFKGGVTLRVTDPPASSGDRNGTLG